MSRAFGEVLQRRRLARKLTRAELAHHAGLSAPAISRLERDQRSPTKATVRQLADAMRLDGEERDGFFLAAGYAPGPGWELTSRDPLIDWLRALLAHPAMTGAHREAFLAPALRTMGIIAAGLLVRQGIAFADLPPPPRGSGLTAEVVTHELKFGIALTGE